jgi:hypothetical protein
MEEEVRLGSSSSRLLAPISMGRKRGRIIMRFVSQRLDPDLA